MYETLSLCTMTMELASAFITEHKRQDQIDFIDPTMGKFLFTVQNTTQSVIDKKIHMKKKT